MEEPKPGRELDVRVVKALPIKGVKIEERPWGEQIPCWKYNGGYRDTFAPSTDPASMWTLIEALITLFPERRVSLQNRVNLRNGEEGEKGWELCILDATGHYSGIYGKAQTAGVAVCMVALEAARVLEESQKS